MESVRMSIALQNAKIYKKEKAPTKELVKFARELQHVAEIIDLTEKLTRHDKEKAQLQQTIKTKQCFKTGVKLLNTTGGTSWVSTIKRIWEWLSKW